MDIEHVGDYHLSGPELAELTILNMNIYGVAIDMMMMIFSMRMTVTMKIMVMMMKMMMINTTTAMTWVNIAKKDPACKREYTGNQAGSSSTNLWTSWKPLVMFKKLEFPTLSANGGPRMEPGTWKYKKCVIIMFSDLSDALKNCSKIFYIYS